MEISPHWAVLFTISTDWKRTYYKFILSWIFPVILYIINTFMHPHCRCLSAFWDKCVHWRFTSFHPKVCSLYTTEYRVGTRIKKQFKTWKEHSIHCFGKIFSTFFSFLLLERESEHWTRRELEFRTAYKRESQQFVSI